MEQVQPGMVEHSMVYHTKPKMRACNHLLYKPSTIIAHRNQIRLNHILPIHISIEIYHIVLLLLLWTGKLASH